MARGTGTAERILLFIAEYVEKNGFSPTIREISDGTGIQSTATVHRNITRLIRQGSLTQTKPGTARSVFVNTKVPVMEELIHLCLQTSDGGTIILNCVASGGKVVFKGQINSSGCHNGISKVIACHELDEDSYYEAMIG